MQQEVLRLVPGFAQRFSLPYVNGVDMTVDPQVLIEKILVSPTAPSYLLPAVRTILGKFGLNLDAGQSTLNKLPT